MIAHSDSFPSLTPALHRRGFLALLRRCRDDLDLSPELRRTLLGRSAPNAGFPLDIADAISRHLRWSPSTLARVLGSPTAPRPDDVPPGRIWSDRSGDAAVDRWLTATRRCLALGATVEAVATARCAQDAASTDHGAARAAAWFARAALTSGGQRDLDAAACCLDDLADPPDRCERHALRALRFECDAMLEQRDPWRMVDEVDVILDTIRAPNLRTSSPLDLELAGWWCVSAARVAWRALPRERSSDRMLGILTSKLDELATILPQTPLRRELDLLDRAVLAEEVCCA